jgi:hypothetical protein
MAARVEARLKPVNKKMLANFGQKKGAHFPGKTCFAVVRVRLLTTWRIND